MSKLGTSYTIDTLKLCQLTKYTLNLHIVQNNNLVKGVTINKDLLLSNIIKGNNSNSPNRATIITTNHINLSKAAVVAMQELLLLLLEVQVEVLRAHSIALKLADTISKRQTTNKADKGTLAHSTAPLNMEV